MKTMDKRDVSKRASKGSAPVWIGVGLLFSLMAMAWTAMGFYSSKHRPAEVPLATRATAAPEAR